MHQRTVFLPVVCVALFWLTRILGATLAVLDPSIVPNVPVAAFSYYSGVLVLSTLAALIFGMLAKRMCEPPDDGSARGMVRALFRPFPLILLFLGALTASGHLTYIKGGYVPVPLVLPSMAGGMLWPAVMVVFFALAPPRHWATALAASLAVGELVWVVASPFAVAVAQTSAGDAAAHVRRLIGLLYVGAGMALALAVTRGEGAQARIASAFIVRRPPESRPRILEPLAAAFGTAVLFHFLTGFGLLAELPKLRAAAQIQGPLHYLTPIIIVTMGRAMDSGARGTGLMAGFLTLTAFAAPLTGLMGEAATGQIMPLFVAAREVLMVFLLVNIARATGWAGIPERGALFVALAGLVYAAYLLPYAGTRAARAFFPDMAGARAAAGTVLGVLFALALAGTLRLLARFTCPDRPEEREGAVRAPEPELARAPELARQAPEETREDKIKKAAFAEQYALTRREAEILDGLMRHGSADLLREELGVSAHTVKYHLRGLLQKTGLPNRRRLIHFYTLWSPGKRG